MCIVSGSGKRGEIVGGSENDGPSLEAPVRREVERLKKEVARKESELASLNGQLKRCERVYDFLADKKARGRARRAGRRTPPVNWDAVLKALPQAFTISDLAKTGGARAKSKAYLNQVAVRWAKEGKVKRIARGEISEGVTSVQENGGVMAVVDKGGTVTLEELIVSSLATADALAKLLIEKGLISAERVSYQAMLKKLKGH